jgi:hypothetical protein
MRKTFIGRIVSVGQTHIVMADAGGVLAMNAGAVTLEQARMRLGHLVRYTVELSEETRTPTEPKFVIGSEFGLQAVPVGVAQPRSEAAE